MKSTAVFNCLVLLGGREYDKVPRLEVTEQEIKLLRAIHGHGSVLDVVAAGERMLPDGREALCHLARSYGLKRVEATFDVALHEYADWLERAITVELEREEQRLRDADAAPAAAPKSALDSILAGAAAVAQAPAVSAQQVVAPQAASADVIE